MTNQHEMNPEEQAAFLKALMRGAHIDQNVMYVAKGASVIYYQGQNESSKCRNRATAKEADEFPEEAEAYWSLLQEHSFTDAEHRLLPTTTRAQAMYIADCFADRVQLKHRWSTFEKLWGIKNLAQEKWKMQDTGKIPARYKEIEDIFSN